VPDQCFFPESKTGAWCILEEKYFKEKSSQKENFPEKVVALL
jgi:hypothetical protein